MNCRVLYRSHSQEAAFFALPSVKHQPHCLNRLILADQSERHALNWCIANQFLDFHSFLKSDCFLIQIKSDFFASRIKPDTRGDFSSKDRRLASLVQSHRTMPSTRFRTHIHSTASGKIESMKKRLISVPC